jgi:ubiquinone/menaquinone biosynthesis C-methylase UbiE
MGIWRTQLLPRVLDKMMSTAVEREIRARVCADLHGDVLELGFGSGLNLEHLPPAVTSLAAVEPSAVAVKIAQPRIATSGKAVRLAGLDGQRIELPDASVDTALSTWTLCTIPDAGVAIAEVRRILRPGGTFHFVEHGDADNDATRQWQRRFEPLQKRVGGGCHLTRRIDELLTANGLVLERLDRYYAPKVPKAVGSTYEGVARPA